MRYGGYVYALRRGEQIVATGHLNHDQRVGCTYSILLHLDWIRDAAQLVHPCPLHVVGTINL